MEHTGESLVSNQRKDALFEGTQAIQAVADIFPAKPAARKIRTRGQGDRHEGLDR